MYTFLSLFGIHSLNTWLNVSSSQHFLSLLSPVYLPRHHKIQTWSHYWTTEGMITRKPVWRHSGCTWRIHLTQKALSTSFSIPFHAFLTTGPGLNHWRQISTVARMMVCSAIASYLKIWSETMLIIIIAKTLELLLLSYNFDKLSWVTVPKV